MVSLSRLIRKERVSWNQKCKIKWAKEGDCNTRFFHREANGRKNKNHIDLLILDNGVSKRDSKEIEEEIMKSFSNLLSPEVSVKPFLEGIDWNPILPREDEELVKPSSLEEIKTAVFSCEGGKSHGADGFSMAFLQKNWDLIKVGFGGSL